MRTETFSISTEKLQELKGKYPNLGKNSDVGMFAVEIAKLYFQSKNSNVTFPLNKKVDLCVEVDDVRTEYEIKGTADKSIAWSKLKVSSKNCYNRLIAGMQMIRITNIGEPDMLIYFMKCGEDFILEEEARWSVKRKI